MSIQITDGEVNAIKFIRSVRDKAPAPVKSQFNNYLNRKDWSGLTSWANPTITAKLGLGEFTKMEVAEVEPLTNMQQNVYLFVNTVEGSTDPGMAKMKASIAKMREWGGWESIAKMVQDNPKIPFQFSGADVQAVLDPARNLPALTHSQIQAKTFLNTIAADPNAAALKDTVAKMQEWGGWESIAKMVQDNPKIPFQFSGTDVKALLDPQGLIVERSVTQIDSLLNIWRFYSTLEKKSEEDANIRTFFADINQRVQHGCWDSIANSVNNNAQIPFKGFTVPDLQTVLDPRGQYGNDPECNALKPPAPPAWTIPISWTIQAGKDIADWTTGAANDVGDWTVGAANDVGDWTVGAANDVGDWTVGAANDVGDWTTGAANDVGDWTTVAANDVADWTTVAANDVERTLNPSNW
jgi:hypothetical protein